MATPIFKITDGTTTINLFGGAEGEATYGWVVKSWLPSLALPKGGGVWSGSPLSEGRSLVSRQRENIIDNVTLSGTFTNQDSTIRHLQDLRILLEKAIAYWTTDWQGEPVWIETSGSEETNVRYAIIKDYATPSDPNPFAQPMFSCPSSIGDFILTIEHSFWSSEIPGGSSCVELSEGGNICQSLYFNGDTYSVNCGSDATIDNLPSGDFTAEAWIYANDAGEASLGRLFTKELANAGWFFGFNIGNFEIYAGYATSSYAEVKADHILDGEWHHVAAVFDVATKSFALYIDGVAPPLRSFRAGAGGYVGDAGQNLYIGNNSTSARGFDGNIGWCRLSNTERYSAEFTPPPRCMPPEIDGNTRAQWSFSETDGVAATDYSGNDNNATVLAEFLPRDCTGPISDTCEREVVIANQNTAIPLTHIYRYDQSLGSWSSNLIYSTDYKMFPDPPAVNDAIIFGIDSTGEGNPFWNLVFNLGVRKTQFDIDFEYYNGAGWTAISATYSSDMTSELGYLGKNIFSWSVDGVANWSTGDLNTIFGGSAPNVTGWWIRARVTAIYGGEVVAEQHDDRIYSSVWNTFDLEEDQVDGDVEALARGFLESQSDFAKGTGSNVITSSRLFLGLRSLSRGSHFQSIIPLSKHVPYGLTFTLGAGTSSSATMNSSTGYCLLSQPVANSTLVSIAFGEEVIAEYTGTYRAFIRYERVGGTSEDFKIRLSSHITTVSAHSVADIPTQIDRYPVVSGDSALMDMGTVSIPPISHDVFGSLSEDYYSRSAYTATLSISCVEFASAAADIQLFDLILIPIDEWSADVYYKDEWAGRPVTVGGVDGTIIDVDSIMNPRRHIRAMERLNEDNTIVGARFSVVTNGRFSLHPYSAQRIHVLTAGYDETTGEWLSVPGLVHKAQLFKQERYLSMRGNR